MGAGTLGGPPQAPFGRTSAGEFQVFIKNYSTIICNKIELLFIAICRYLMHSQLWMIFYE